MLSLLMLLAMLAALLELLHPPKPPTCWIAMSWSALPPPVPRPPPAPPPSTLLPLWLLLLLLLLPLLRPASLLSMLWNGPDRRRPRDAPYGCDEEPWGLDNPSLDRSNAAS